MTRHYVLNEDGKTYRQIPLFEDPRAMMEFGMQLLYDEARNVGDDELDGYRISTKFIGIDTTPSFVLKEKPDTPPRVFETMVFGPDAMDVLGRFSTWEQADLFHVSIIGFLTSWRASGKAINANVIEMASGAMRRKVREWA